MTAIGGVKCWGHDEGGELGDGTLGDSSSMRKNPTDVCASGATGLSCVPLTGITAVAAVSGHTCALTALGTVKCWGDDSLGALGDGTTGDDANNGLRLNPVDVCANGTACTGADILGNIVAIAAGANHTCALTAAGTVKCWGSDDEGALGNGTDDNGQIIAEGGDGYTFLNPVDVCVSTVNCAGSDLLSNIVAITAGANHTCALTQAGTVKCWGNAIDGALGDGTTGPGTGLRLNPVDVCASGSGAGCPLLSNVIAISAGGSYTCALIADGTMKCWGDDLGGQLGDGTDGGASHHFLNPVDVCTFDGTCPGSGDLNHLVAISAGAFQTCALTDAGHVKCWGMDGSGQLGDGTTGNGAAENRLLPVDVCATGAQCIGENPLNDIVAISTGDTTTCALSGTGNVLCWGDDTYGELGDGKPAVQQLNPISVCDVPGVGAGCVGGGAFASGAFRQLGSYSVSLP